MNKSISLRAGITATLAASMTMFVSNAIAHSEDSLAGAPVCLEANFMMADAQFGPWANTAVSPTAGSAGRVLEMNTTTGERGITVDNPFTPANVATPICPTHVSCSLGGGTGGPFGDGSAPWKPTGNTSGGENGHAYLTSAAQHALVEHHRDGTAIRTNTDPWYTSPSKTGGDFGFVPRILGNGFMPNGNIAQAVCDANFFNAPNSDGFDGDESAIDPATGLARPDNSSWMFFPPVYSTTDRGNAGTVLIIDQETLAVVDEYRAPTGANADPRWNCPAGVLVTSEGLFISMFHGDAVFVVDWKAGIDDGSRGLGSNDPDQFVAESASNEAVVLRVIDLSNDGTGSTTIPNYDDSGTGSSGHRRDNLRAIRMSEDGTLFGTRRSRTAECLRGEAPGATPQGAGAACNPRVFRQHIFVADAGEDHRTGTLALDPGVNIIAGVSINRMSGPGCVFVRNEITGPGLHLGQGLATGNGNKKGGNGDAGLNLLTGDECDVETLYVGVSAGNAGCDPDGDGNNGPGHPANQCFVPGGTVYEYRIDAAHLDGSNGLPCTGDPADGFGPGEGNEGCALPIAQFEFVSDGTTSIVPAGEIETVDPRMLMHIHEAFNQ